MATMKKGQSLEDLMTEPNQAIIDNMQEVMVRKAQELFRVCDKEEKGFINKKDMQRLREELPVSPDQLEVVFDSLDEDGNGFLTLEEFTDGFGSFLGLAPKTDNASRDFDDGQDEYIGDEAHGENGADEEALFNDMIRNVGAANVFQDEDVIKAMWRKLYKEDQEMSSTFEDFLARLSDDIQKSKVDFSSLESALVSKSNEHEEEVRKLYEEMELQIKQERERILAEEKQKEKQLKTDMEEQMLEKERQLLEITTKHQEMEERLRELNVTETSTKQENERLQREKDKLEEMLSRSQDDLEESRSYIAQIQDQQKDEKRERARQAILMSEGIAIERESLVKQLDILKDVNKKLRDDKDEAEATEARRDAPKRLSLQDELQVEQAASDDQNEATSGTKRGGGRKELQKQGSVLSKYFPTSGPPPKYSTGSLDVDVPATMMECDLDDDDVDVDDDDVDEEVLRNANVFMPGRRSPSPSLHDNNINSNNSSSISSSSGYNNNNTHGEFNTPSSGGTHLLQSAAECSNISEHISSNLTPSSFEQQQQLQHERHHQHQQHQRHHHHHQQQQEEQQQERNESAIENNHMSSVHAPDSISSELGSTRTQPVGADAHNEASDAVPAVPKPSRVFKVVIIGDSSVGKSTFIHRFCHQEFKGNFNATIGVDFQIKTMTCKGSTVILQLWDTAGQERFRSMTRTYFRKADGVIIMYDVTSEKTFMGVREWMLSVQEQVEPGTVLALLGNKYDMAPDDGHRPVKTRDGLALAVENEAIFFETSAKSGLNVTESMQDMTRLLQEKEDKKLEEGLTLSDGKEGKKKKCCG